MTTSGSARSNVAVRMLLALTPLVGASIAAPVMVLALRNRLPDQAYGMGGYTGTESWETVALLPAAWTAAAAACVVVLLREAPRSVHTIWLLTMAWPVGATVVAFVVTTVARHLDRARPGPEYWWTQSPVAEVGLLLLAVLAWWVDRLLTPPLMPTTSRPDPVAPRIELGHAEVAVWTRTVVSIRPFVLGGAAVAVMCGLLLAVRLDPLGRLYFVGLLGFSVVLVLSSWVQVRVDTERVSVVQPLLRRPLVAVELRHVVEARARVLDHREPGFASAFGYGLGDTGRTFGLRSRRAGEALSLLLTDGREFLATVDDAATAAALVTTLLDRRGGGHGADPDRPHVDRAAR